MDSHLQALSNLDRWNLSLRIQRRGNFFSDDGFQDFRRYFEIAAKDFLQDFDVLRQEDSFTSYRKLRDRQLSGTDRAAKIAEEKDKYKIVMDVEGFADADLQVKVSGPNEISVEGRQEISNGGTFSNRFFRRRFSLPGLALIEDATSVLSSDNILTVNIPKKIQEITSSTETSSSLNKQASDYQKMDSIQESVQKSKDLKSSFLSDFNSSSDKENLFDLQIVPRNKSFFDDSYFENVRQNFQKSVDEMMEKRHNRISSISDAGIFEKVRKVHETKEDRNIQATSVTEDLKEHKIVVDVHGFAEGDLKVRAVSETEVVVTGNVEKKTECTSCSHTFKRRFILPSSVNIRQATSALSSEGILTITVPKRIESIDYTIPVKTEAATHLSNVIKQEQERESSISGKVSHERYVPVVQEGSTSVTNEQYSNKTRTTTTTSSVPSSGSADSQILLNKLERTVQMCDEFDNRKQPTVSEVSEKSHIMENKNRNTETQYVESEPSEVIKESQKLISESAKLIQEIGSNKYSPSEHYVPVELDAGKTISTTGTTTHATSTRDSHQQSNVIRKESTETGKYKIIPISLKGSFYNEPVFDDARKTFDEEVKDVFTKYKQSAVTDETKDLTEVKSTQKSSDLLKSTQTTSTILDDANNYKIVVDVYGFEESELSVRTSGINEISIEGISENVKAGSMSKHSFKRTFQLPECADIERAFTALSEEGILTVTVPKKNKLLLVNKKESVSSKIEKELQKAQDHKTFVIDSSGIVQERKSESLSSTSSTSGVSTGKPREYVVPVTLEDSSDIHSEAGSIQATSNLSSQISTTSTSRDVSQDILSTSTSCSSIDTQVQAKSSKEGDTVIQVQGPNLSDIDSKTSTKEQSREIVTKTLFDLPIVPKGHFFDDNFFLDSRSTFESLLRNKMNRFSKSSSFVDDLGFFRSLRENKVASGNQMGTLSEDDQSNKIVLDVHGFSEDNLKIRVLKENEIVIEGSVEEKAGNSISKRTFRKHFVLPGSVNLKNATSALSSDGVLNIKIPKKI